MSISTVVSPFQTGTRSGLSIEPFQDTGIGNQPHTFQIVWQGPFTESRAQPGNSPQPLATKR